MEQDKEQGKEQDKEQGSRILTREERLKEFFQANPQEWRDIKAVFLDEVEYFNEVMSSKDCVGREWYAGMVNGLKKAAELDKQYKEENHAIDEKGQKD